MRAALHAGLALAVGVGAGAAEAAHYSVPAYEQKAEVAACNLDLGHEAVIRSVVPPACAPFPETIDVTGTATGIPSRVRYSLPSSADFEQTVGVEARTWQGKLGNNETFDILGRGALAGFLCLLGTTTLGERHRAAVPAKPKSTHYNH